MFAGLDPMACYKILPIIYDLTICTAVERLETEAGSKMNLLKVEKILVMLVSVTHTLVFCLCELQSVAVTLEYFVILPLINTLKLTGKLILCFEWLLCIVFMHGMLGT